MKRLVILLLALLVASPALAVEYRVISDLQFADESDAISFINEIENIKEKVRTEETLSGYVSSAKFVESWDTELNNQQEETRFVVDFSNNKKVHSTQDNSSELIEGISKLDERIANVQAKLDKLNAYKTKKQEDLNALNP